MRQWILPALLVLLALISLLVIKSVIPELAIHQALFFGFGLGVFFFVAYKIKFSQLQTLAWPLYGALILLLLISYFYGVFTGHTGRWIPILGIYNLQPSQLAIPIGILALTSLEGSFDTLWTLLKGLITILFPAGLILIEPDLGTTIVYLVSVGSILLLSEVSNRKILSLLAITLLATIFSWNFVLHPYQKQRITSFINSSQDTKGAGYNAKQALIAAGSGHIIGRGLGQGIQSHLRFLPERQTDFIFASLAEESGFIGSSSVLIIYVLLINFIIKTGLQASRKKEFYYCLGIAVMTAIQAGVNIGMNIGLLPITGLTLPLLSYGGSSIISLMSMFGLVQSIALRTKLQKTMHLS